MYLKKVSVGDVGYWMVYVRHLQICDGFGLRTRQVGPLLKSLESGEQTAPADGNFGRLTALRPTKKQNYQVLLILTVVPYVFHRTVRSWLTIV